MTRNGASFARPTWERRTSALVLSFGRGAATLPTPDASHFEGKPETWQARRAREQQSRQAGGSAARNANGFGLTIGMIASTLPTPQAYEADHGGSQHPDQRRGHQVYLSDVIEHQMMPTPRASDGPKGGPNARGSSGDLMMGAVAARLPTPGAGDGKRGADPQLSRPRTGDDGRRTHEVTLNDAASALLPTPTTNRASHNTAGDLLVPGVSWALGAANLPTPAARDWKSGASNLLGTNARPLNEIVETGMRTTMPTPKASDGNGGPWESSTRQGANDLRTTSSLLPTPTGSDGTSGNERRGGARNGELLLAGLTRAMLQRGSSGEWVTTTSQRRSKRGKRSRDDPHPSQQCLIEMETGGSTPGSVSG